MQFSDFEDNQNDESYDDNDLPEYSARTMNRLQQEELHKTMFMQLEQMARDNLESQKVDRALANLERGIDHTLASIRQGTSYPLFQEFMGRTIQYLNEVALNLLQQENIKEALKILDKCNQWTNPESYQLDPSLRSLTFNHIGCCLRRAGKTDKALQYFEKALKLLTGLDNPEISGQTHVNLCAIYSQIGEHKNALEHAKLAVSDCAFDFVQATKIDPNQDDGNDVQKKATLLAIAYHNLGNEEQYTHNFESALQSFYKAFKLADEYYGEQDRLTQKFRDSYDSVRDKIISKNFNIQVSPQNKFTGNNSPKRFSKSQSDFNKSRPSSGNPSYRTQPIMQGRQVKIPNRKNNGTSEGLSRSKAVQPTYSSGQNQKLYVQGGLPDVSGGRQNRQRPNTAHPQTRDQHYPRGLDGKGKRDNQGGSQPLSGHLSEVEQGGRDDDSVEDQQQMKNNRVAFLEQLKNYNSQTQQAYQELMKKSHDKDPQEKQKPNSQQQQQQQQKPRPKNKLEIQNKEAKRPIHMNKKLKDTQNNKPEYTSKHEKAVTVISRYRKGIMERRKHLIQTPTFVPILSGILEANLEGQAFVKDPKYYILMMYEETNQVIDIEVKNLQNRKFFRGYLEYQPSNTRVRQLMIDELRLACERLLGCIYIENGQIAFNEITEETEQDQQYGRIQENPIEEITERTEESASKKGRGSKGADEDEIGENFENEDEEEEPIEENNFEEEEIVEENEEQEFHEQQNKKGQQNKHPLGSNVPTEENQQDENGYLGNNQQYQIKETPLGDDDDFEEEEPKKFNQKVIHPTKEEIQEDPAEDDNKKEQPILLPQEKKKSEPKEEQFEEDKKPSKEDPKDDEELQEEEFEDEKDKKVVIEKEDEEVDIKTNNKKSSKEDPKDDEELQEEEFEDEKDKKEVTQKEDPKEQQEEEQEEEFEEEPFEDENDEKEEEPKPKEEEEEPFAHLKLLDPKMLEKATINIQRIAKGGIEREKHKKRQEKYRAVLATVFQYESIRLSLRVVDGSRDVIKRSKNDFDKYIIQFYDCSAYKAFNELWLPKEWVEDESQIDKDYILQRTKLDLGMRTAQLVKPAPKDPFAHLLEIDPKLLNKAVIDIQKSTKGIQTRKNLKSRKRPYITHLSVVFGFEGVKLGLRVLSANSKKITEYEIQLYDYQAFKEFNKLKLPQETLAGQEITTDSIMSLLDVNVAKHTVDFKKEEEEEEEQFEDEEVDAKKIDNKEPSQEDPKEEEELQEEQFEDEKDKKTEEKQEEPQQTEEAAEDVPQGKILGVVDVVIQGQKYQVEVQKADNDHVNLVHNQAKNNKKVKIAEKVRVQRADSKNIDAEILPGLGLENGQLIYNLPQQQNDNQPLDSDDDEDQKMLSRVSSKMDKEELKRPKIQSVQDSKSNFSKPQIMVTTEGENEEPVGNQITFNPTEEKEVNDQPQEQEDDLPDLKDPDVQKATASIQNAWKKKKEPKAKAQVQAEVKVKQQPKKEQEEDLPDLTDPGVQKATASIQNAWKKKKNPKDVVPQEKPDEDSQLELKKTTTENDTENNRYGEDTIEHEKVSQRQLVKDSNDLEGIIKNSNTSRDKSVERPKSNNHVKFDESTTSREGKVAHNQGNILDGDVVERFDDEDEAQDEGEEEGVLDNDPSLGEHVRDIDDEDQEEDDEEDDEDGAGLQIIKSQNLELDQRDEEDDDEFEQINNDDGGEEYDDGEEFEEEDFYDEDDDNGKKNDEYEF